MLALLALLIPQTQADKVLDRNAMFMQKLQSLTVDFKIALVAQPFKGKGKLAIQFPRRTRFDVKLGPIDYSLGASEEGVLELEHSTKHYMEDLPADFVGVPSSKISFGPQVAFPGMFIRRSLKASLPPEAKYTYLGKGGNVDKVHATWAGPTGTGEATAHIDGEGKVTKLAWRGESLGEVTGNEMDFTNYVVNKPVPMSTFRLTIPSGYVPYALPTDPVPPEPGQMVKLGKWSSSGAEGEVDLDKELAGKPALLFVMSRHCAPSNKARAMVESLSKEIRVVELLSDTWDGARTNRARFLWGGKAMDVLAPPVTPSFYLMAPNGTMHRMWYGFDAKSRAVYEKDIRESIKELR